MTVSWNCGIINTRIIDPEISYQEFELYKLASDKVGTAPTISEEILSGLKKLNGETILSDKRKSEWYSKLISLSI